MAGLPGSATQSCTDCGSFVLPPRSATDECGRVVSFSFFNKIIVTHVRCACHELGQIHWAWPLPNFKECGTPSSIYASDLQICRAALRAFSAYFGCFPRYVRCLLTCLPSAVASRANFQKSWNQLTGHWGNGVLFWVGVIQSTIVGPKQTVTPV